MGSLEEGGRRTTKYRKKGKEGDGNDDLRACKNQNRLRRGYSNVVLMTISLTGEHPRRKRRLCGFAAGTQGIIAVLSRCCLKCV